MDLKLTLQQLILVLAGWAFAFSASAQYQWMGKDGRKVFSDRPPPADIQEKDILKQPGGRRAPAAAAPAEAIEGRDTRAATAAAKSKSDPNAPKISGKDADLEAKKKKLQDEELAKKKAEDDKIAKGRLENCDRVKKGLASLQSGDRISTVNAKGEREFMDDAARAAENKRLKEIIDGDCR